MTADLEGRSRIGSGPLTPRYDDALLFAARHHRDQLRKGSQVPYLSHLMSVSSLVLEHGGDEDTAIAALLHDAVEDAPEGTAPQVLAEVATRFGEQVAAVVRACSDGLDEAGNRSGSWVERKVPYLAAIPTKSPQAQLVTAADKTHNARCLAADARLYGDAFWGTFNACRHQTAWYYASVLRALEGSLGEVTILALLRDAVMALVAVATPETGRPTAAVDGPPPCTCSRRAD